MAGVYIHIPFCKQACYYCNFHFATSLHYKQQLIETIVKEIALQKEYLGKGELVETIYFGGGTPSLCTIEELHAIIAAIRRNFTVDTNAEITLEANPDDITEASLSGWKEAGINRLSIGIQSFFEEDLQWMNRAHTATQAIQNLQLAITLFSNITIDLIYGTPQLTTEKWKHNVSTAIALKIPHLSCYALTVEPKTPLDKMIRLAKSPGVDPEKQSEQFLLLMEWMADAGYEHYEISNFAKAGRRSRHNSSYWAMGTDGKAKKYLGLGPSAHSYNGAERQWNVANNSLYETSIQNNIVPFEKEVLTSIQKLNEYIMTALRTMEGISLNVIHSQFNIQKNELLAKAALYINRGHLQEDNNCLVLTREGKLLADGIASGLFF